MDASSDGQHKEPARAAGSPFVLASLNIHGMKAGWPRRSGLVLDELTRIEPDVVVLQEAARWAPQPRWIAWRLGRTLPGRHYRTVTAAKRGWWWFIEGLAVLARLPVVDAAMLDLRGDERIAQRLSLRTLEGRPLDVYNVHLPHRGEHEDLRLAQVERLLAWVAERPEVPAVVAGDFNAAGDSAVIARMLVEFRSAYGVAHGVEPDFTAPASSQPGGGRAIDFIFVSIGVEVLGCELAFRPVEERGRLVYPSDHLGLAATLRLSPQLPPVASLRTPGIHSTRG
jgi:endonuclease/exonuclease/phosphatase family metal-dependent hydrolase